MRPKEEMDTTDSPVVYRRLRKLLEASCSYCPWHKKENQKSKPERSWKRHRKEQYK